MKNYSEITDINTRNKNNIAQMLAQEAINKGSYDNVSVVLVFF